MHVALRSVPVQSEKVSAAFVCQPQSIVAPVKSLASSENVIVISTLPGVPFAGFTWHEGAAAASAKKVTSDRANKAFFIFLQTSFERDC